MKCSCLKVLLLVMGSLCIPHLLCAQDDLGHEIKALHVVLEQLYDEMVPLCSRLISVGRGLAGFAAIWYIASRVWGHLARAEPIDFYPLFRPFVLGLAILLFPAVLDLINGVMKPTVTATAAMVEDSDKAITELLKLKEAAIKNTPYWQMYVGPEGEGDREKWYKYYHGEEGEGMLESLGNDIRFAMAKASYNFRSAIKQWLSEILKLLFEAASLCIDTIRTFYLVVLALLGPLVFGIAVFDGFQHTLTVWIARYLNVFLWLPVANLFGAIIGKVQEKMLQVDLAQIGENGDTFFSTTDAAYLVFLIIGIVGYLTVPSVANYIVHAGGGNVLLQKVTHVFSTTSLSSSQQVVQGGATMVKDVYGTSTAVIHSGMAAGQAAGAYFKDKIKGGEK